PLFGVGEAASAETPADAGAYDVAVPPVNKARLSSADQVTTAGATGYVRYEANTYEWVPYGGGAPRPLSTSYSGFYPMRLPDGTERVAYQPSTTTERLLDPATGTATDLTLPTGYAVLNATGTPDGWAVTAYTANLDAAGHRTGYEYHLLAVEGDAFRDVPLSGMTHNVPTARVAPTGEAAKRLVLVNTVDGRARLSLVDPTTGAVTYTADEAVGTGASPVIRYTGDAFATYADGTAKVYSMDDPQAAPRTVSLPPEAHADTTAYDVVLTDSSLLAVRHGAGYDDGQQDLLYAVPLDGGPATEALADAGAPQPAADGGAFLNAGSGTDGWDTYRIAPSGGAPTDIHPGKVVEPVRYGLSLARGELTFMEGIEDDDGGFVRRLYGQDTGVGAVPRPGSSFGFSGGNPADTCDAERHCSVALAAGSETYGTAYVHRTEDGKDAVLSTRNTLPDGVLLDSTGGRIVDESEYTALYNSGSNGKQYVISPGYRKVVLTRPIAPAALWGDTLWTATGTKGQVAQTDLRSDDTRGPIALSPVTTDAPCVIKDVQALGRWLYWSCGANGPAGVYDRTAKRSVSVPAGPALLGDGFVLRHPGDALQATDLRTGSTRTVAALPASTLPGGDRGVTWTVDRSRGQIAYIAPDTTIHLIPSGTASSPLDVLMSGMFDAPLWVLSGPAASWTYEVRKARSGALVRTITGGAERSQILAEWDGKDDAGHIEPDGRYAWTLTADPANGVGPAMRRTGAFSRYGSIEVPRDYNDEGIGDLLALTPSGRLDLRTGTGTGGVAALGPWHSSGWATGSTYIPIGDQKGSGTNDLLVRDSAGRLTRYDGSLVAFAAPTSRHTLIGGGWNIYTALTSPGDLTGDGRPDLLARDASGVLWRYDGQSTGLFAARVRIGGGWNTYNSLAGAQDLTGDGVPDLLARDTTGVLWRYDGDGKGTLKPRVRIGSGWNVYNAIVGVGDLTGDDRNDLVARDTTGALWRYTGTGKGLFAPRVKIGWGWQSYKALV
ncbi:MAG TPA: FG-GAP-like repeat-containing protein, partial [Streptomyces sp.]